MREIKFRGKCVDSGEWVYGNLIVDKGGGCWIVGEMVEACEEYCNIEFWRRVDPATVGQFTGLKDKNGAGMWNGDVVDGSYTNPMTGDVVKILYVVDFGKACFMARRIGHSPYGDTLLFFINERAVVIGNIHDNPELLGVVVE